MPVKGIFSVVLINFQNVMHQFLNLAVIKAGMKNKTTLKN